MGLLAKIFAWPTKAAGEYRPGPYMLDSGWLPAGTPWNFWQLGQSVRPYAGASAMVEACVGAYSQTIAMCPGGHWRLNADGGRTQVKTSALAAVIRRPNDYQSISDFLLNLTRSLYTDGNAYALALRNERNEIDELHLMAPRASVPMLGEDGSIFYALGGNEIVERRFGPEMTVPARDVLHVRLHTPREPLKGVSPIVAAALDLAARNAALEQQVAFFLNQAKPGFILSTDQVLTRDQIIDLRERWDAQTKGANAGGTPILAAGLKPQLITTTAKDAELAELLKLSDQSVALAYRVPLQILGIGGTPFASTEALMQAWVASGLGFALNHIEEAFGNLFGLKGLPDEYVEFSTKALLRSAFKDRVEGLVRGIQGGLYSPDEGRNEEELPTVPGGFGAEPRVQAQVLPLSAVAAVPTPSTPPTPPVPPAKSAEEYDTEDAESRMIRLLNALDRAGDAYAYRQP